MFVSIFSLARNTHFKLFRLIPFDLIPDYLSFPTTIIFLLFIVYAISSICGQYKFNDLWFNVDRAVESWRQFDPAHHESFAESSTLRRKSLPILQSCWTTFRPGARQNKLLQPCWTTFGQGARPDKITVVCQLILDTVCLLYTSDAADE